MVLRLPTTAATGHALDIVNVRDHGARCDDATDDTAAVIAAHAQALSEGLMVFYPGICRVSADIPGFHTVPKVGSGGVRAGGRIWWAEPSPLRNPFSARQTVYVDATLGLDTNAGIGPGALAVKTFPGAESILGWYGRLSGTWSVTVAAGEYDAKVQFFGCSNDRSNPLYIEAPAPASAWNNATPPANADATGGSVPTVLMRPPLAQRGLSTAGVAIDVSYNLTVIVQNIKFRDWGDPNATSNEGAMRVARGWLRAVNCHVWDSGFGINGRDFSEVSFQGGIYHNCRRALYAVAGCRYDTGIGASAGGQTTAALFRQCEFGIDLWEQSTGHPDYAIYEDNGIHIYARKGSHGACRAPTFRNTGAHGTSQGVVVRDNGIVGFDGTEIWTGTHLRRIVYENSGLNIGETFYSPRRLWGFTEGFTEDRTTVGTTPLTVASTVVPLGTFVYQPQEIRFEISLNATNPTASVGVSLRANGVFVGSVQIPINAGTSLATLSFKHKGADRSNTQFLAAKIVKSNTAGTAWQGAIAFFDVAVDMTTADQTIAASVTAGNAADSIVVKSAEIWRVG